MKSPKFCQQFNCVSWRSQHPSAEKSWPVLISNAGKTIGSCRSPLQSMKRHNQLWTCFCLCNCGQHCCCSIKWSCWEQTFLNVGSKLPAVHYSIDGAEPVFVTVSLQTWGWFPEKHLRTTEKHFTNPESSSPLEERAVAWVGSISNLFAHWNAALHPTVEAHMLDTGPLPCSLHWIQRHCSWARACPCE